MAGVHAYEADIGALIRIELPGREEGLPADAAGSRMVPEATLCTDGISPGQINLLITTCWVRFPRRVWEPFVPAGLPGYGVFGKPPLAVRPISTSPLPAVYRLHLVVVEEFLRDLTRIGLAGGDGPAYSHLVSAVRRSLDILGECCRHSAASLPESLRKIRAAMGTRFGRSCGPHLRVPNTRRCAGRVVAAQVLQAPASVEQAAEILSQNK